MKHTKGPWKVTASLDTGNFLIKQFGPGQVICELDPLPEVEANARLIAAAPEMKKALQKLVDIAPASVEYSDWPELQKAVDKANDILAKAEVSK